MSLLEFPEPQKLDILEIGDNKDHRTMVYSVANPHPGYGKDPNILNELGHSVYPKMVYPNGKELPGVLVKNEKEEKEALGQVPPHPTNLKAPAAGTIDPDKGPTIEEYVKAGYNSKSSPEEIKIWIDKEKSAAGAWG